MPGLPKVNIITDKGTNVPTFQQRLVAALAATPEDSRAGYAPSQKRPMPKQKVAAAWLHCLRLSLAEIANAVRVSYIETGPEGQKVKFKALSYGLLAKWRTEEEFQELILSTQIQMGAALVGKYNECFGDLAAFDIFGREVRHYANRVRNLLIRQVKEMERVSNHTFHKLGLVALGTDYWLDQGKQSAKELRREIERRMPTTAMVDGYKELFTRAQEAGDWNSARHDFEALWGIARHFAEKEDARWQSIVARMKRGPRHTRGD